MRLILEGPDGAGKTTLAQHFVRQGHSYSHEGPPKRSDLLQYYANVLLSSGPNTVFDRLYLGELVYGPIYRRVDRLGIDGARLMSRLTRAMGIHEIVCLPPFSVCLKNWSSRKTIEMIQQEHQYYQIYSWYEKLVEQLGLRTYDYTKDNLPEFKFWNELPPGMVGDSRAKFLFVGEKANHDWLDLPFFSSQGSSFYLTQALIDAGYQEEELAFVNAYNLDGELWHGWSNPYPKLPYLKKIITLGDRAYNAVTADDVPLSIWPERVPHPAYWKRFHSRERNVYVELLKRVRESAG